MDRLPRYKKLLLYLGVEYLPVQLYARALIQYNPELVALAEKYIEGNTKIEWQSDLQTFGMSAEKTSGATEI